MKNVSILGLTVASALLSASATAHMKWQCGWTAEIDPWLEDIPVLRYRCWPARHFHFLIIETQAGRDARVLREAEMCIQWSVEFSLTCLPPIPSELETCDVSTNYPDTYQHRDILADDMGDKLIPANPIIQDGEPCPECLGIYDGKTRQIQINPSRHEELLPNVSQIPHRTGQLMNTIVHERLHRRYPLESDHQMVINLAHSIIGELFGSITQAGVSCNIDWSRQVHVGST